MNSAEVPSGGGQRKLFDAGLAGICVPKEYDGQGLTYAHQLALNEELTGYEHATFIQVPTMTPCMAVLLDFASEEIKKRHIPRILRGEPAAIAGTCLWMAQNGDWVK